MKRWRRLASLVLAAVMCLSLIQLTAFAVDDVDDDVEEEAANIVDQGSCGDEVDWVLYEDGRLVISGTGDMTDYGGYNEEGEWAWICSREWSEYTSSITSVQIENGVTSIGTNAFGWSAIQEIDIPDSVTKIGGYAFYDCSSLQGIDIPDRVTEIGAWTFDGCTSLQAVVIPDSVTEIGAGIFNRCTNLQEIALPDGLTSISQHFVHSCSSLTSLAIPDSVTEIGDWAFAESGIQEIAIPDGVTEIGEYAFYHCTGLQEIALPDGLVSISEGSFDRCTHLTSLAVPSSVTEIGDWAFIDSGVEELWFSGDMPAIDENVFSGAVTIYYPADNATWTQEAMDALSAEYDITWVSYTTEEDTTDETWTDSDNGVTVSGDMPEGTRLVVSVEDAAALETQYEQFSGSTLVAYDISLCDLEGNRIQPEEGVSLTVTAPVPEDGIWNVYHEGSDGLTLVGSYQSVDQTVTFLASSFSTYIIVLSEDIVIPDDAKGSSSEQNSGSGAVRLTEKTPTSELEEEVSDDTSASGRTSPKTGDSSPIAMAVVMLVLCAGALAVLQINSRKRAADRREG